MEEVTGLLDWLLKNFGAVGTVLCVFIWYVVQQLKREQEVSREQRTKIVELLEEVANNQTSINDAQVEHSRLLREHLYVSGERIRSGVAQPNVRSRRRARPAERVED